MFQYQTIMQCRNAGTSLRDTTAIVGVAVNPVRKVKMVLAED